MPLLPLVYGAEKREIGRFPEMVLRNCTVDPAPTQQETPLAVLARPGTADFQAMPGQPLRGCARKAGLFGSDALILADATLVRVASNGLQTAFTGAIPGRDRVKIDIGRDADDNDVARIATGDALYIATGGTVALEPFPEIGGAGAQDILFHRGFWIGIEAGTDKAYFQVPGETTWNALDFASAEYQPDWLVGLDSLRDQIWMVGGTSAEVFSLTGTDPAIAPYGGLAFDKGCRARDSIVSVSSLLFWVDERSGVQMTNGGEPIQVASAGIVGEIRKARDQDIRAWGFGIDNRTYYILSLGFATWVYEAGTKSWATWDSTGQSFFKGHLGCEYAGQVLALDADPGSAQVWQIDPEAKTDAGDPIECELSAYLEVNEGSVAISNIELIGLAGDAPRTGQGSAPLMAMRYSKDGGKTWSNEKWASMHTTGKYAGRVRWKGGMGLASAPYGLLVRFRSSEPVGRRWSGARYNAA